MPNHPKTIRKNDRTYQVVRVVSDGVLVDMHEDECYGMYSRMTFGWEFLRPRQRKLWQKFAPKS